MSNEELVAELQQQYDEEKIMILWNQVEHYIRKIAWKYVPMLRCSIKKQEDEDLVSEGYFALVKAIKGYDPNAGMSFLGYLTFYLHSAFSDYIARDLGSSRSRSYRVRMLQKFEDEYISLTGKRPSDEEVCRGIGVSYETLQSLRSSGIAKSVDEDISEDGNLSLLDRIPSEESVEDDVIDGVVRDQVRNLLRVYIDELPVTQRRIIHLVYYRGFTDQRASDELNMKYSQLLAEKKKALDSIGKSKHLRELGRFLPERYEALAFHGGLGSFMAKGSSSTEISAIRNVLGK